MNNYNSQTFASVHERRISILWIPLIALIFTVLGSYISYKALGISERQLQITEMPHWRMTLDNQTQNVKIESLNANISFQQAAAHFPGELDSELKRTILSGNPFSGTYFARPPYSQLYLGFISNGLKEICEKKSAVCYSDQPLSFTETYPSRNTLLAHGLPMVMHIEYVFGSEVRRERLLYLLPFRKSIQRGPDEPDIFFEQPQLIKQLATSDDEDTVLDSYAKVSSNKEAFDE